MDLEKHALLKAQAGTEDFSAFIENGYYYVDKTRYIRPIFEADNRLLLLRPRRFGKTLTMSMLRRFLEMDYEHPGDISAQQKLFKGLKVTEDREFCQNHMGRYPVVMLTLKEVDGLDFRNACDLLGETVWDLANSFEWLKDSPRLNDAEKKSFNKLLDEDLLCSGTEAGIKTLQTSLKKLCGFLRKHCGRKIVLLIDEYDVPLQKAVTGNYYEKFSKVIGVMLGSALKTNGDVCKGILSGCLRATKEGIFTGLNNFTVDSVLTQSDSLCTALGFTPDEVKAMLGYYGFGDFYEKTRSWYDGYSINGRELFCPWDVSCYVEALCDKHDPAKVRPEAYWNKTSSSRILTQFMPGLDEANAQKLQELLDGGSIEVRIDEGMNYGELDLNDPAQFWNLLVYAGYLTLVKAGERSEHEFRIPNAEVRQWFNDNIMAYYRKRGGRYFDSYSKRIVEQLLCGNADELSAALGSALSVFVSSRDLAVREPKENYYHGMLNGILVSSSDLISALSSNTDSEGGYADITFLSRDRKTGVVIELKYAANRKDLSKKASEAVEQIEDQDYAEAVRQQGMRRILGFGIAFCRRQCAVAVKDLKVKA